MGKKKSIFFSIYDEKSAENFILGIYSVEKCLIRGVLTNFCKNVPFWGPYLSWKHFSYPPLNLSRQGASFKHPYDYFLSDDFLTKKVAKLVETQKFCQNRLNHSFFLKGSYSHFLIWWIIRKLAFFSLFWGFSNGTLKVTPLVSTEKYFPLWFYNISKNSAQRCL